MFGQNLKTMRESLGLSQIDLSKRSGVPQSTISAVESGIRIPREDTMVLLARGLGCKVGALMDDEITETEITAASGDKLRTDTLQRIMELSHNEIDYVNAFLLGLQARRSVHGPDKEQKV